MVMVPPAQRKWLNPDAGRGDRAGPEVRLEDVELVHDDAGQLGRARTHDLPYQHHGRLRCSGLRQKSTEIGAC